ncbi:MAG TPA: hypothetical protein VF798_08590 [Burkholderiaceae bacterium]
MPGAPKKKAHLSMRLEIRLRSLPLVGYAPAALCETHVSSYILGIDTVIIPRRLQNPVLPGQSYAFLFFLTRTLEAGETASLPPAQTLGTFE